MKKAYFLILLIFLGCGTRKKTLEKTSEKIETTEIKDIVVTEEKDVIKNTSVEKKEEVIIYTPIDNSKPIEVDGKKYLNTKVEKKIINESKDVILEDKTVNKVVDNSIKEVETIKEVKKLDVERDNSFSFFDWFWLLLAICAVVVIVWKRGTIYSWIKSFI